MVKTNVISNFDIQNMPSGEGVMHGIAGNFDRISQSIYELVDNSISNILANKDAISSRTISIHLEEKPDGVSVAVKDGGTGIRDLDLALTLAGSSGETVLNEHGFGFKQALASVSDGRWFIQTRTAEDAAANEYKMVESPYSIQLFSGAICEGRGELESETGTVIGFVCSHRMFETLKPKTERKTVGFQDLIRYLMEELGYAYAPLLQHGDICLQVITVHDGERAVAEVAPLLPQWQDGVVELPEVKVNLTEQDDEENAVTVLCTYGTILPSREHSFHYLGNLRTSGVEIRINGRAIEHLGCDRVWGEAVHPSQNKFLAVVDLHSANGAALPATRTAKIGFREGDPRFVKLLSWIRSNVERPEKDTEGREAKMVRLLAEKLSHEEGVLRVSREEGCFQCCGVRAKMDLFVSGDQVRIFEAKVGNSKAQDLYQLRMYWDGCAKDGKPADQAILIARHHPKEVYALLKEMSGQLDMTGRAYNFVLTTWSSEGIAEIPA